MENNLYITIVDNFSIEDVNYVNRQQFLYVRSKLLSPKYNLCCECKGYEQHHIGLDCDGNEHAIPAKFSVLEERCIDQDTYLMFDMLQKRRMDKTEGYYEAVKRRLGIDMRQNHYAQINPDPYKELDLLVPKGTEEKEP